LSVSHELKSRIAVESAGASGISRPPTATTRIIMALDPVFVNKTDYARSVENGDHSHAGGIAFGGESFTLCEREVLRTYPQAAKPAAGGGLTGRNFGGNTHGWKPFPANAASAWISNDPQVPKSHFPPSYVLNDHFSTTASMSYTAPCWPVGRARRLTADGINGEHARVLEQGIPPMRSIGGHEAFPVPPGA
jgi:hypothetical protein